jgi:CHASE3 domain sensor protein
MVNYSAYMALVVGVILVIVAHAWFVRRLSRWRDRSRQVRETFQRLHAETLELAETVDELERGKESNAVSIQTLERESEEIEVRIREFLSDHPELQKEFSGRKNARGTEKKGRDRDETPAAEAGQSTGEG